jgi:hypothetical protein
MNNKDKLSDILKMDVRDIETALVFANLTGTSKKVDNADELHGRIADFLQIISKPNHSLSKQVVNHAPGYNALWNWFGLSYSTWITLPRVLVHEMPDDWQARMYDLMQEWENTWDFSEMPSPYVLARKDNKFTKWPAWLLNYRHPSQQEIERLRRPADE